MVFFRAVGGSEKLFLGVNLICKMLVGVAIASFPVVMGTVKSGVGGLFYVILLMGVPLALRGGKDLLRWEKKLFWGFLAVFAYCLASIAWADDQHYAWRRFEKIGLFALSFPAYLLIRRYADQAFEALIYGLIAAGPVMLWSATTTMNGVRAQGAYNHILFGDFTLLTCLSALSAALLAKRGPAVSVLLVVSAACALYASLLTQTRGPLLVLPVALCLFLWVSIQRFSGRAKALVLVSVLVLGGGALGGVVSSDIFQQRTQDALQSYHNFKNGELTGSIGPRLAKWSAAISHWRDSPWFGSGLGDYWHDTQRLVEREPYYQPIAEFSEAHSLYFESLATLGIVGTVLLVYFLLLYPLSLFWRYAQSVDAVVQYLAFNGMLIVVAVMNNAVTQNWLARSSITMAYILFLVILLAGIARRIQVTPSDKSSE